jgi:hypothetical protein
MTLRATPKTAMRSPGAPNQEALNSMMQRGNESVLVIPLACEGMLGIATMQLHTLAR